MSPCLKDAVGGGRQEMAGGGQAGEKAEAGRREAVGAVARPASTVNCSQKQQYPLVQKRVAVPEVVKPNSLAFMAHGLLERGESG